MLRRDRARGLPSKKRSSPLFFRKTSGSFALGAATESTFRRTSLSPKIAVVSMRRKKSLSWRYLFKRHDDRNRRSSGLQHRRSVIARRAFGGSELQKSRLISEDQEGRNRANRETEDDDWNDLLRS
jgi:hypothetical protein